MPFYSYHCQRCDRMHEGYRHISQRNDSPECCGEKTLMVIVPPAVQPDLPGYLSPVTGKWIEGKSARREDLQRTGSRPYEGRAAEQKESDRQRQYQEQKEDAARRELVSRVYYSLPEKKRRALKGG
jgi:hypothetical protein